MRETSADPACRRRYPRPCAPYWTSRARYGPGDLGNLHLRVAANTWPFLQVSYVQKQNDQIVFTMVNSGVGPAKLERFEVLYEGKIVATTGELLERCCNLTADPAVRQALAPTGFERSALNDTVFRPGEEETVPTISRAGQSAELLDGCYCSVFDECWTAGFIDLHSSKVRSCPAGPSFNAP